MLQAGQGLRADGAAPGRPGDSVIYRFDQIEVDPRLGCLKREGREQHLRQQSFHLLLYMVERRDRLISKEELVENFWQGSAVTDNAVVQCIKEIRKVLGDDPHVPRFIKTIHKSGYRFIAPVVAVPAHEDTPCEPLDLEIQIPLAPGRNRKIRWIVSGLVVAMAFSTGLWWVLNRPVSQPLQFAPQPLGNQTIAVMYFENQSARPDLAWLSEGMADMFMNDLAHFDHLTVLSRQQLHELLQRSRRPPSKPLRLEEALEVGRLAHAQAVLLGTFGLAGGKILVHVRLCAAPGGHVLTEEQFVVDQPWQILTHVDLLAPKLAASLGASTAAHRHPSTLRDVMTDNVEAYRYYSVGVSKASMFQNSQATELLRKAIQLDPKFAMAYARIGYAYAVTDFLQDKGRPFLAKAMQLSDRLTPKDRMYVAAWYAIARQDYADAIRVMRQIIDQYPSEMEAYTRLARLLYSEERIPESIAVVRRGLAVDAEYGDLYNVLGVCFLGQSRYEEAIAVHQRYLQLAPAEPNAHDSLGMSLQQAGRYEAAVAEFTAALSQDPDFEPAIIHLGDAFFQQGRYRDAIHQYQRYTQVTGSETARAVGYGSLAQVYACLHDFGRAARLRARSPHGEPYPARGVRKELRSYEYQLGMTALRKKEPEAAVAHFQAALRHVPPTSGMNLYEDCLANAYLELNRLPQAIVEYQRILHLNPNYPLAHYHLAQAYQRNGELDQARQAYQTFLQVWKSADANIPELVDARQQLQVAP